MGECTYQMNGGVGDSQRSGRTASPRRCVHRQATSALGKHRDVDFYGARVSDNFYVRWTGVIHIEKRREIRVRHANPTTARVCSIDGVQVVSNGGVHPPQAASGSIELGAGDHKLVAGILRGRWRRSLCAGLEGARRKETRDRLRPKPSAHQKAQQKIDLRQGSSREKLPKGMAQVGWQRQDRPGRRRWRGPGNAQHEKMDYGLAS